jgi:integral membrane protein
MPLAPRAVDIPRIPGALKFYKVMSYITGTFLLLLVAEMILKYCIDARSWSLVAPAGMIDPATGDFIFLEPGFEIELFGSQGFLALVPNDSVEAINLSIGILVIHGWLYVIYLFSGFRIWSMMRWNVAKLFFIALGGIIPGLSFVIESIYGKKVVAYLATQAASNSDTSSSNPPTPPTPPTQGAAA